MVVDEDEVTELELVAVDELVELDDELLPTPICDKAWVIALMIPEGGGPGGSCISSPLLLFSLPFKLLLELIFWLLLS